MTRAVWKLVHRMKRLYKRSEGKPYGMSWMNDFEAWGEAWEELQRIAVAEGAGVLCSCGAVVVTVEVAGAHPGECVMCGQMAEGFPPRADDQFTLTAEAG
jgi:hypothetical protein